MMRRRHAQHASITPFATISAKGIAEHSASSKTVPLTSIVAAAMKTFESKGASASVFATMWIPTVVGGETPVEAAVQLFERGFVVLFGVVSSFCGW